MVNPTKIVVLEPISLYKTTLETTPKIPIVFPL